MIKPILSAVGPETLYRTAVGTTSRITVMMVRTTRTRVSMRCFEYKCTYASLDFASSSGPEKSFCTASVKRSVVIGVTKKRNVRVRDPWGVWLSSLR